MMDIYLTEEEREMVRAQRVRLHGPTDGHQRPSVVLRVRDDGEVEIVYAFSRRVKTKTKRGVRIDVMAVATTATDSDRILARNLVFTPCGGYRVYDWSARCNGPSTGFCFTRPDGTGEIWGPVANPEVLRDARPCYRYAGLVQDDGRIRPAVYLRALHDHPGAELLFKAGLSQLLKPSILKRGPEIAPFIARHRQEIDRLEAGASAVMEAWRKGITVEEAVARETARHDLRGCPRAPGVDVLDIARWLVKANVRAWEYRRHCEHCAELGLGAEAYMPSPKRFRAFAERVEAEVAEAKRRKERRDAAALAGKFKRKQLDAAAACPKIKGIVVLWPDAPVQLVKEGKAMRNCIGNGLYSRKVANGESLVFLLRLADAPEEPWVDVELRRKGKSWSVAQCYAKRNAPAPDTAHKAARRVAAAIRKAALYA
jgi:hypothetical protein